MTRMTLKAILSDDKETATIELWDDKKPYAHINLSAPELEGCIHRLGEVRALMAEQPPESLDTGARLSTINDPRWQGADDPPGCLALRHPGFGWLSFCFPPKEAAAISAWLSRHSG